LNLSRNRGLDLLEKDEVKEKRPSMWNIVFYNDDYTPMDFVEFVLKKVFHILTEDALALTFAVHTQGKGIAGTYSFEVAEQKQFDALLMAKVEEHPRELRLRGSDDRSKIQPDLILRSDGRGKFISLQADGTAF
jgi:ATP-dependent Clp protease adaptor protein ClpS